MAAKRGDIVSGYARMWPREIFDERPNIGEALARRIKFLEQPGVYILYQNERPHYIGRTDKLFDRLFAHARPQGRYAHFWNLFSAFAISDIRGCKELEAILIAAMPTANSAKPKLNKERMPREVVAFMKRIRYEKVKSAMGKPPAIPRPHN